MVPKKPAKTRVTPVESVEERAAAEGKSAHRNARRAQDRERAPTQVERIGERAKEKRGERFDNLLSPLKVPLLTEAYQRLRSAAPGVDGVTWKEYGEHLDARLLDLQDRIHRGSYHPQPVRRVHIPKGDGGTRPLGIPALEDKVVQQAVRMVLEPIYERAFLGFSYGFRPGRSPHDALNALAEAISRKVNWVLDADIRSFFDTIDHGWMQKFIEHRIGDRRMVRLLMKLLRAGVMEDGELREVTEGTPQGGNTSPLLANIYLHYALDLWARQWRNRQARGEMYIVRYADDFVMGFQYEQDALAMREALATRLAKFGLELHPDKTRVIRFGRFAASGRNARARKTRDVRLPRVHAHRRAGPAAGVPTEAPHLAEEAQGEAGCFTRRAATAPARPVVRTSRGFPAFSGGTTATTACPRTAPRYGRSAASARAGQPAPTAEPTRAMEAIDTRLLPSGSLFRFPRSTIPGLPCARASVDPRWEPGAGNPLAGFCPGGGPKGPSLPGPPRPPRGRNLYPLDSLSAFAAWRPLPLAFEDS